MACEVVERPVPCPDAFAQSGVAAAESQAALLLMIGQQLRGDHRGLAAFAAAAGKEHLMEALPEDDIAEFPMPRLRPSERRIAVKDVTRRLASRYGKRIATARIGGLLPESIQEPLSDLARKLYEQPEPLVAAQLLEASLRHPEELTRVAAASSYFELSDQPARLIRILAQGTRSAVPLVRDVAATVLAHVAPEHSCLRALMKSHPRATSGTPSHTSLLVHGTFARSSSWWQPGGDFHSYLLAGPRPDLYRAPDRFEWSGGYSDAARSLGATDLAGWVSRHALDGLDLFAHSHGASIAMLATQNGMGAGVLVLLSCPVHIHKHSPDFTRVRRVVSIRVRFDLVILADRGGQRFRHPQIEEHVLPLWFDHSATHEPEVWEKHRVASTMLGA